MKITKHLLLLLFGMGLAPILHAEQTYIFEDLDSNSNGAISMSEAKARPDLEKNFKKIDTNGDNSISVDEYSRYMNEGSPPEDVEIPEPGAAPVN